MKERDYIEHHVMWNSIRWFIVIKLFLPEGIERITRDLVLSKKAGKQVYTHAVVTACVVEIDKLFALVDALGTTHKIAPAVLMQELYDTCCKYNSGLLM